VHFDVYREHDAEFREALLKNASDSLSLEEDCRVFDVCSSLTDSNYFLYEVYASEAAFAIHLKADHFLQFSEKSGPWVRGKTVTTYTLLGCRGGVEGQISPQSAH
jgi:quinol monooxygenase YgiN